MAYDPGKSPFNPLMIGALVVVAALAAFLLFRESTAPTQQAGIETPPAALNPSATPAPAPAEQNPPPTVPDPAPANPQAPQERL